MELLRVNPVPAAVENSRMKATSDEVGGRPSWRLPVQLPLTKEFLTVVISTAALIVVCRLFAPSSVTYGAFAGSLPFAAILAIVGLGQMLVVQQGGFDLLDSDAVVECAFDVQFNLGRPVQGSEHCKVHQAAGLSVEGCVTPRPTPCPGGGRPLKRHHELVSPCHRGVDIFWAQHVAPDRHAFLEQGVVVSHVSPFSQHVAGVLWTARRPTGGQLHDGMGFDRLGSRVGAIMHSVFARHWRFSYDAGLYLLRSELHERLGS